MPESERDHYPAEPLPPKGAGSGPAPEYRAYVLRCWREASGWRFGLEDPHTGAQRGFPSLPALVTAIRTDLATGDPPPRKRVPRRPPAGSTARNSDR